MSLNPTYTHKNTSPQISQKDIVDELKIFNCIDPMAETTAFLTLKDHKPDFENHTKCRLINPAKSDIGKISKSILDTVNSKSASKPVLINGAILQIPSLGFNLSL